MKSTQWMAWVMATAMGVSGAAMAQDAPRREERRQRQERPTPPAERGPRDGERREATERRRPEPGARIERLQNLLESLDLSEEQKTRLNALFDQARTDAKAFRGEKEQADGQRRERMRRGGESLRAFHDEIDKVLTPEQRERLQQKMSADRPRPGNPDGPANRREARPRELEPGQRIIALADKLELTGEQRRQIDEIASETREKIEAARKVEKPDPEAIRGILSEGRDKLHALLTPEQRETLRNEMWRGEPRREGLRQDRREDRREDRRGDRPNDRGRRAPDDRERQPEP